MRPAKGIASASCGSIEGASSSPFLAFSIAAGSAYDWIQKTALHAARSLPAPYVVAFIPMVFTWLQWQLTSIKGIHRLSDKIKRGPSSWSYDYVTASLFVKAVRVPAAALMHLPMSRLQSMLWKTDSAVWPAST